MHAYSRHAHAYNMCSTALRSMHTHRARHGHASACTSSLGGRQAPCGVPWAHAWPRRGARHAAAMRRPASVLRRWERAGGARVAALCASCSSSFLLAETGQNRVGRRNIVSEPSWLPGCMQGKARRVGGWVGGCTRACCPMQSKWQQMPALAARGCVGASAQGRWL